MRTWGPRDSALFEVRASDIPSSQSPSLRPSTRPLTYTLSPTLHSSLPRTPITVRRIDELQLGCDLSRFFRDQQIAALDGIKVSVSRCLLNSSMAFFFLSFCAKNSHNDRTRGSPSTGEQSSKTTVRSRHGYIHTYIHTYIYRAL